MLETPKDKKPEDLIYSAANLLLASTGVGGQLFQEILRSPYQRRVEEWQIKITDTVNAIQQEFGLSVKELSEKPAFVTILISATQVALRTHHERKLETLQKIVAKAADLTKEEIDKSLLEVFVRYVDELTPLHMLILGRMKIEGARLRFYKSYPQLLHLLNKQLPNLSKYEFILVLQDLSARGLIRISKDVDDFGDLFFEQPLSQESMDDSLPRFEVTSIGLDFIEMLTVN